ncbi:MAG: hypothetical protein ACLP29_10680 [Dissulfurispiraceae bacterium]
MSNKRKNSKAASHKTQVDSLAQFRQRLWGGKNVNPKRIFRDLHAFRDFREMSAVAEYVKSPNHSYHRFVFGTPFARSYKEVISSRAFAFTDNLQRDLDWMSLSVVRYAKDISSFIKQTVSFQKAFLLGSYDLAYSILDSIISDFGISLWAIDKRFLLAEYAYGLESNKTLLTQIVSDDHNDVILQFLAEHMSMRCEAKLSDETYRLRVLRTLDGYDKFYKLMNYCRYRLGSLDIYLTHIATHVTYYEGLSPIIDRYLTFVTILQSCAVANSECYNIASHIIRRVDGLIQDFRMDALVQFFIPERQQLWTSVATDMLAILDNYTEGDYESSATASNQLLIENPEIYELYYIYIRSLDHLGQPFTQVFPKESAAASILEHSNVVIKGEKSSRTSSDCLSKLSLSLWRDPLAYGLFDFYAKESLPSPEKRFHRLALLNASPLNPRFATIYGDPDKAQKFLVQLSRSVGDGSTVSLIRGITVTSHSEQYFEFPQSIPEIRRQIYSAELHENAGRSQYAISILKPLLTKITEGNQPGNVHARDRVTLALFRCYLDTNQLAECTDMVVSSFLQNELSTRKLSLNLLVEAIDETSHPDVMRKITYPILYSIVNTKARAVYVAYDNFLSSLGLHRPTQLFDIQDQFCPKELNEFLSKVCTIDVLACSYHFTGTKDLDTERIRICQFLSERDSANLKTYSNEISTITSRSLIRKGMRQIDVSKIYVYESGVRTAGRKLFEESFARYRELASMSSIETLQMLDTEVLHFYTVTEEGEIVKKPMAEMELTPGGKRVVHTSLLFLIFKELFIDVRDRFISRSLSG